MPLERSLACGREGGVKGIWALTSDVLLWIRQCGQARAAAKLPSCRVGKVLVAVSFCCSSIQGWAEWGSEQPYLVDGVPTHGRGVELDELGVFKVLSSPRVL